MKLDEFPAVHIEWQHAFVDLIKLNILFRISDALRVEVIANDFQILIFYSTLDCKWTNAAHHIGQNLIALQKLVNEPVSFGTQLGAPVHFAYIDLKSDFIFNLNCLIFIVFASNAFKIVKPKFTFYLSNFADHRSQLRILILQNLADLELKWLLLLAQSQVRYITNCFKA